MKNLNVIVEEAKKRGDYIIQLEEETYEITEPIELSLSDVAKPRRALKIKGAGMNRTIINSKIVNGDYCFVHTQSSEQAKAYSFSRGLEISDLTIKGLKTTKVYVNNKMTTINAGGIKLQGAFFYTIKNVEIVGMKQNGIYIPYDANLDNDMINFGGKCDAYASGYGKFENLVIQGCDGWGYRNEIWGSSPNMENCMIVENEQGGIFLSCPSAKISSCGIAQNGKSNEKGGGILISYNSNYNQTPHNVSINHCELDTNYNYQVCFDGCKLNEVTRCRFIDRVTSDGKSYYSKSMVKFCGDIGQPTLCNVVQNSTIRLNASSLESSEKPEITLFNFENAYYSEVRRVSYDIDENPNAQVWKGGIKGNIVTDIKDEVIYQDNLKEAQN